MTSRTTSLTFGLQLLGIAWLALAAPALAQDPFADPPAGGAPMPVPGGADPFAAKPAAGAALPPSSDPTKREPLVIQQIRDSNPTTPGELMRAAMATWQFGRPDEARRYLAALLAAKPAEAELAALAGSYADVVVPFSLEEPLQPEGKLVADALTAAAQKEMRNLDRLNALIAQLSNEDLGTRQDALRQLAQSGPHVVTPALRVLADATLEAEHRYIRAALAHLNESTELPMLGALEIPNDYLKAQVIIVLGRMASKKAMMHLVRPAVDPDVPEGVRQAAIAALTKIVGPIPTRYEAERYLQLEIDRLLAGDVPYAIDHDNLVTLWHWNDAQRALEPQKLPRGDAGVLLASQLANDLYALRPQANEALRLKLLTNLELAKVLAGLDRPLPIGAGTAGELAIAAGPWVISQVLGDAIEQGRIPAAIAAAEILATLGDPSVLYSGGAAPAPLAEALSHPDRRVRFTAALACVKLAPGKSFPGASRVAETLGLVAATSGSDFVLVAHPRGADAQSLVAFMNELGYDGHAAYIGRSLADEAFVNPDCQFVLIGDAIDLPPVFELVQWLRRDFRTARLPVGVMAISEDVDRFRFAFRDDPFTTVFPRLHSRATAEKAVAGLLDIAGRNLISRDERIDQAQAALAALAILAKDDRNLVPYQLLRQEPAIIGALNNPAITSGAAAVLALLATPNSQTALVEFASQTARDLVSRQEAAAAFAAAVARRGLRLTQEQIAHQYARYNASETLDKPTQDLLGSILDTIEAPAVARGDLTRTE